MLREPVNVYLIINRSSASSRNIELWGTSCVVCEKTPNEGPRRTKNVYSGANEKHTVRSTIM